MAYLQSTILNMTELLDTDFSIQCMDTRGFLSFSFAIWDTSAGTSVVNTLWAGASVQNIEFNIIDNNRNPGLDGGIWWTGYNLDTQILPNANGAPVWIKVNAKIFFVGRKNYTTRLTPNNIYTTESGPGARFNVSVTALCE